MKKILIAYVNKNVEYSLKFKLDHRFVVNKLCFNSNSSIFFENGIYNLNIEYLEACQLGFIQREIQTLYDCIGEPDVVIAINNESVKYIKMIYPFSNIFQILTNDNFDEYANKICHRILCYSKDTLNKFNNIFIKNNIILNKLVLFALENNQINFENLIENTEKQRIVICSTQYPHYGGAATNAYYIHKYLLANDYHSLCIFFYQTSKETKIEYNPEKLDNVFLYNNLKIKSIPEIDNFNPDIIYCKNYLAPLIIYDVYKSKYKIVYLVAGSIQAGYYAELGIWSNLLFNISLENIEKQMSLSKFKHTLEMEKKCIDISNEIITNSFLSYKLTKHCYSNTSNLLYPSNTSNYAKTCISYLNLTQTKERIYDIAFICSNLNRKVKNFELFNKLIHHERLKNINKLVIGNGGDFLRNQNLDNVTAIDAVNQSILFEYLKLIKIVVIPSFNDASPNLAIEADFLGCKILTSNNIGNININYLICNNYQDINCWVDIIIENINFVQ